MEFLLTLSSQVLPWLKQQYDFGYSASQKCASLKATCKRHLNTGMIFIACSLTAGSIIMKLCKVRNRCSWICNDRFHTTMTKFKVLRGTSSWYMQSWAAGCYWLSYWESRHWLLLYSSFYCFVQYFVFFANSKRVLDVKKHKIQKLRDIFLYVKHVFCF